MVNKENNGVIHKINIIYFENEYSYIYSKNKIYKIYVKCYFILLKCSNDLLVKLSAKSF